MRLRHPSGRVVHLSCEIASGAASALPDLVRQLDTYGAARARIGADLLGVNIWLPPALATALAFDGRARSRLRAELDARRLDVVTLNGGQVASFDGGQVVAPFDGGRLAGDGTEPPDLVTDWSDPARREFTLDLARILLDLLDEEAVRGAVGTIGMGQRAGWSESSDKAAAGILRTLSAGLADLAWQNGRAVRVGLQPSPGLVLDTPEQTVAALARIDKERLGICLDLGHAARTWPDPAAGIEELTDAGLSISEVRVAAQPGATTEAWRSALRQVFGAGGPLTEYLTLLSRGPDTTPEQVGVDVTHLLAELAAIGLAPENEPCPAR